MQCDLKELRRLPGIRLGQVKGSQWEGQERMVSLQSGEPGVPWEYWEVLCGQSRTDSPKFHVC